MEELKNKEKQLIVQQSDYDKEKALFQQKIKYLEDSLEENISKERDQMNEMKNTKKDHISQIKEVANKYESVNKNQQQKINNLTEKSIELENELFTARQQHDIEKKKWQILESQLTGDLSDVSRTNEDLKNQIKSFRKLEEEINERRSDETNNSLSNYRDQIKRLEEDLRDRNEEIQSLQSRGNKESAILQQKIDILENQNRESQEQMEENKKTHEMIMRNFQNQSGDVIDNRVL